MIPFAIWLCRASHKSGQIQFSAQWYWVWPFPPRGMRVEMQHESSGLGPQEASSVSSCSCLLTCSFPMRKATKGYFPAWPPPWGRRNRHKPDPMPHQSCSLNLSPTANPPTHEWEKQMLAVVSNWEWAVCAAALVWQYLTSTPPPKRAAKPAQLCQCFLSTYYVWGKKVNRNLKSSLPSKTVSLLFLSLLCQAQSWHRNHRSFFYNK